MKSLIKIKKEYIVIIFLFMILNSFGQKNVIFFEKESFPSNTEFYKEKISSKYLNEVNELMSSSYVSNNKIIVNTNDSISKIYELFFIDSNLYSLKISIKYFSNYYEFNSIVKDTNLVFKKIKNDYYQKSIVIDKCKICNNTECFKKDNNFCKNGITYEKLLSLELKIINDVIIFNNNKLLNNNLNFVKSIIYDKNISLLNYFKYRKDSIPNDILKYTEGYSQAYEIYLEDKSNDELNYLLNQYSTDTRWTNPPKAYVIAKVLYLRTSKTKYLETLRKMYKIHNRLIKEEPPEFYEYEILKAPFKDEYLLKLEH
jgi:hypothetical protein